MLIVVAVRRIYVCCFNFDSILQRSQKEKSENVKLDVYLLNGHKKCVEILSTDQTDDVLEVNCDVTSFLSAIFCCSSVVMLSS